MDRLRPIFSPQRLAGIKPSRICPKAPAPAGAFLFIAGGGSADATAIKIIAKGEQGQRDNKHQKIRIHLQAPFLCASNQVNSRLAEKSQRPKAMATFFP